MQTLAHLADLLDYPTHNLRVQVAECVELLGGPGAGAGRRLADFCAWVNSLSPAGVEETYTAAFEAPARCAPYAGHHLLGPGHRRGLFLAELNAYYRRHGFSAGNELPDHLPVLLRFLSRSGDSQEREELIEWCVLPALTRMLVALGPEHPYRAALDTVALLLEARHSAGG